jgi:hypothetical protein
MENIITSRVLFPKKKIGIPKIMIAIELSMEKIVPSAMAASRNMRFLRLIHAKIFAFNSL